MTSYAFSLVHRPLNSMASCDIDLQTPKVDVSCPCAEDHLCQLASKSVHSFSKYCVHKFGNRQMNGRMEERINGQVEKTMPLPASLASWRHRKADFILLSTSSPNACQFSKFFHRHIIKEPNGNQMHSYTHNADIYDRTCNTETELL